jgi:hypothetical protein
VLFVGKTGASTNFILTGMKSKKMLLKHGIVSRQNRDYEKISNNLLQKSADEIIDAITRRNEIDRIFITK